MLTASVLATYTAFIFGANATRKSAKCDSFHYCAASHSAVNCLIDCWRLVRSSLTALVAISNNLSLSCHFSRVRLYSPFFAGDRHWMSLLTFWTYLMRCTYPWHWIKYSTKYNRCHPIFSLSWQVELSSNTLSSRAAAQTPLHKMYTFVYRTFIKFILFCRGQALFLMGQALDVQFEVPCRSWT